MSAPTNMPWPTMRRKLAVWYDSAKRDLPWRRTTDPYAITVSEIMLQQTQVVTVLPYYARWLTTFPTWEALARAKEHEVIKAWEGLGYYRRARNLQALAQAVTERGGAMPQTEAALLALPGIGPYTSAAIGSICFGLPLAVLDGNVMRVLTRLLALPDDISLARTRAKLQRVANDFLQAKDAANHNQAIMELGATVCVPRQPLCLICPLRAECRGRDHAQDFPVKTRVAPEKREEVIALIRRGDAYYCEQVPEGKPWHGLWRFPDFDPARMTRGRDVAQIRYGITKYAVTMNAVEAKWKAAFLTRQSFNGDDQSRYLTQKEMETCAFAAPHRKLRRSLALPTSSTGLEVLRRSEESGLERSERQR